MTKKDFTLIATVLNDRFNAPGADVAEREQVVATARGFVVALRQTNTRFNADRFLDAVTVTR